ncbi:MAG TPA: helix-turn-helix transcriptional regulator [Ktedonobacteraceae bacterium]|nr:helix-turn-helix transcriptional regulator [Ktedonobacteraceae bacterium]
MQEQDQKPSIKQLRIQAGLSVFKLAMKAGISVSTVNRLEKGDRKVSLLSANRVLNILSQELRQEITTNSVKKLFIGEEDQDQEEQS